MNEIGRGVRLGDLLNDDYSVREWTLHGAEPLCTLNICTFVDLKDTTNKASCKAISC